MMEQNSLMKLITFEENVDKSLFSNRSTSISHSLKHLCVLSTTKCASVYWIPTGAIKTVAKSALNPLIWKSPNDVDGFTFSDDGDQFLVIHKTKILQIFDLKDSNTKIISEANMIQLTTMLGKFGIQLLDESTVVPLKFSQQQIIISVDKKWLVGLKWLNFNQLYVTYTVESASCVAVVACKDCVYFLTTGGNLSAYSNERGKQLGVLNLYSILASGDDPVTLGTFHKMSVTSDGTLLAVANRANQIYVVDLESHFNIVQQQNVGSRWNSGDSDTASISSATSRASTRTTASVRSHVLGVAESTRGKTPLFKSTWNNYLSSLRIPKPSTDVKPLFVSIVDTPPSLSVHSMSMTAAGLGVWYRRLGASLGGLYRLYDTSTGACLAELQVPDDTSVVVGGFIKLMDAFVSPSGISLFLGTLARDVLIRKLFQCMETRPLCEMLRGDEWGSVMVPFPIFNDSLRRHQMDVVRLALGLHAQAFKSALMVTPSEDDLPQWQNRIDNTITNMDKIFNSIHFSIQENIDKVSYSKQLIMSTLDHANDLLLLLKETSHGVEAVKKQVLSQVVRLRGYLKQQQEESVEEAEDVLSDLGAEKREQWEKWKTMEDRHVIRLAISQNNLLMVHTYLSNSRGFNSEKVIETIETEFDVWFKQLLANHDFDTCQQILANMSREPLEELKSICVKTLDRELRDTLVEYLISQHSFDQSDVDAWKFLLLIEDVLEVKDSDSSGKLALESVMKQSNDARSMIIHDMFFKTLNSKLEAMIETTVAWRYLFECNRTELLTNWVRLRKSNETKLPSEDQLSVLFSSLEITQSMIDSIKDMDSMEKTKESVLDFLSSYGIFSSDEKQNPSSVIKRLICTKSIERLEEILEQPTANVSTYEFNQLLTAYCLKHGLYGMAFPCLTNCEYSDDDVESLCNATPDIGRGLHWFKLWLTFLELYNNPFDVSFFQKAIVDNALYLSDSASELDSFLKEHPLLIISLIVFGKETINNVLEGKTLAGFPINANLLQSAVSQFPLLEMALSSPGRFTHKADVTVYQLLRDSTLFDVTKLFRWHENGDKGEFLHFSLGKLVRRYGHQDMLGYLYYLKQGRPSFAVNMFLIEQFRAHEKLTKKAKKQACNFAHGLALHSFNVSSICAACTSFIEMLGCDSEEPRVHVATANKILSYLNSQMSDHSRDVINVEQVGRYMHGLVTNKKETAPELLSLLETALEHTTEVRGSSLENTVSLIFRWNLAVKFANIHALKLPEKFLVQCAKKDNWLSFILFIELYKYPIGQVLNLAKSFRSTELQEHLCHALANISSAKKQNEGKGKSSNRLKLRDARKMLYSKIGLTKEETPLETQISPTENPSIMQLSSTSSSDDTSSLTASMIGENLGNDFAIGDDVFLTLLNCHRSPDPPRYLLTACQMLGNPLLAVLATCYEPSSVLACFCTYLFTSLSSDTSKELHEQLSLAMQHQMWSPQQVEALLTETVACGFTATLTRAFKLFLPESPLSHFSEFLLQCVVKKNFDESIMNIKLFKASCLNLKSNPSIIETMDLEGTFLVNGYWISSMAVRLANVALTKCFNSSHQQHLFLHALSDSSFSDHLPVPTPNYNHLSQIVECLSCTGVHANLTVLSQQNVPDYQTELRNCLEQLLKIKKFKEALSFTMLTGLSKEPVIIARWLYKFHQVNQNTITSNSENELNDFWDQCEEDFKFHEINPNTASMFYYNNSSKMHSPKQRYKMLQLALSWLRQGSDVSRVLLSDDEVEIEMWKCWLLIEETEHKKAVSTPKLLRSLKSELLKESTLSIDVRTTLFDEHQAVKLDALIGELLDCGDLFTSCKIETMFNHKNQDLQVLLTCMSLAEGDLSPYNLSTDMRMLLSEPRNTLHNQSYRRRTLQSVRLSNASSCKMSDAPLNLSISSDYAEVLSRERQDTFSVLETLTERLKHGKNVANRVLLCYRVAMNLDRGYSDIIKLEEPLQLLESAVTDDSICNKFLVASDLMSAAQIPSDAIAVMLCGEIEMAISKGSNVMWGCDLDTNFHLVLELCNDPTLLGNKLFSAATKLGTNQPELVKEVVERLVRSHDCYTAACNMEGIASVLNYAHHYTTTTLIQLEQWALMVRLLTGVGRYTEMNYIFQILKEREQFEFLLGQGMDKVSGLKLAVLEFLKQHCPEDRDLFRMVALHFSLYAEVASLWEQEAKSGIHSLLGVANLGRPSLAPPLLLVNVDDTKQCLNTVMLSFTHAAQYYLQANKLTRAMATAHQAELVALQISLVNAVPANQGAHVLLELDSKQVTDLITNTISFPQAWIVARAYSHPVDWGAALYKHCIVLGESLYLTDFSETMTLTPALVEDVVKRFQQEPNATNEMARQMKSLLLTLNCVEVTYRVASQLGFRDVIDNLLSGPELAYLKDTVWQSGYSRQHY